MTIYEQVFEQASPFIERFRDDLLKHDKNDIEAHPDMSFIHFTGDTGTSIFFLKPSEDYPQRGETVKYLFGYSTRERILAGNNNLIQEMERHNRNLLHLYYSGKGDVTKINLKKAKEIYQQYTNNLTDQWRHVETKQA